MSGDALPGPVVRGRVKFYISEKGWAALILQNQQTMFVRMIGGTGLSRYRGKP